MEGGTKLSHPLEAPKTCFASPSRAAYKPIVVSQGQNKGPLRRSQLLRPKYPKWPKFTYWPTAA